MNKMHLNVKIHCRGPRGPLAGLLLAGLLISFLLSSWARNSKQADAPPPREIVHRQATGTLAAERKCQPMLNFGLPQAYATDQHHHQSNIVKRNKTSEISDTTTSTNHQLSPRLSKSIPDIFSFTIGDIDLPLSPQTADGATGSGPNSGSGAVQTAMKLLAAFDSQIYGDSEDDDHHGDEDEEPSEELYAGQERISSRARNVISFRNNKLHLAGLNFTMLNVHLYEAGEPKFAIGINIENTTLAGQFQYDGLAPTASLLGPTAGEHAKLAGHYRMSIDNVLVMAASNLTKVQSSLQVVDGNGLTPTSSKFRLATNELRMNISNLGYISIDILDAKDATRPTSNYVLKMLQRVLQKTIKRTYSKFEDYIRQTLEVEGRQFLDCELTRFSPLLKENLQVLNPSAAIKPQDIVAAYTARDNLTALETEAISAEGQGQQATYLEDLAKIISAELASSHLDRIRLPDFEYQRGIFGSQANINFVNGSLLGLDNIRLNGETRVKLLEEHLIVNASIGWFNLRPHYNWTLYFGSSTTASSGVLSLTDESNRRAGSAAASSAANLLEQPSQQQQTKATSQAKPIAKGFVAFNIKAIDFDAVISKSVRSQSQMVVDELVIRRLESPKMDIGGLPGMNRLTRGVVNFFMGRLKQRLVSSIQPALKQELERALNRLALFN